MIRTILIDIDNTLLDFHKCADACIRQGFREWGLPYESHTFSTFLTINDSLWRQIEQGTLDRAGLALVRFPAIFRALGIEADGVAFERRFARLLCSSHEPVEGAPELLRYLAGKYPVYAASNSLHRQQVQRLELAGMAPYLKDLFTSERMGAQKPTAAFFAACMEKLGNPPKDEVLLIGDSLSADIGGALDFGIRAGWFNHDHASRDIGLPVEFIAEHLSEIPQYL